MIDNFIIIETDTNLIDFRNISVIMKIINYTRFKKNKD